MISECSVLLVKWQLSSLVNSLLCDCQAYGFNKPEVL